MSTQGPKQIFFRHRWRRPICLLRRPSTPCQGFYAGNVRNFERPFTPQTSLRSPRNFVKTHFRRFPTFHFLSQKNCVRQKKWVNKIGLGDFLLIFEELRKNGRQNQIRHQILVQIHLSWGLYGQKTSKNVCKRVRGSGLASKGLMV